MKMLNLMNVNNTYRNMYMYTEVTYMNTAKKEMSKRHPWGVIYPFTNDTPKGVSGCHRNL